MGSISLKSMTGYGRAFRTHKMGHLTIELQSVNRRHLEININAPRFFFKFEAELRQWLSEKIGRGQIHCSLIWRAGEENIKFIPNLPLAKALKEGWEKIAETLKISLPLEYLLSNHELLEIEQSNQNEEEIKAVLKEVILEAINALDQTKILEGSQLAEDFLSRITYLKKIISKIEARAQEAPTKHREKLKQRLEELFAGNNENQEKIEREIALLSEKIDITEEIVRFKSHLEALESFILVPLAMPKGKKIEFILQELQREISTIGSKSNTYFISECVIEAKAELEKMREQVQNIE